MAGRAAWLTCLEAWALREGDAALPLQLRPLRGVIPLIAVIGLVGCGARGGVTPTNGNTGSTSSTPLPQAHPQAVEPTAGDAGVGVGPGDTPVGDPNAHAPPLSEVRNELRLELVATHVTNTQYINPLQYVTVWGRTDQGVDARLPIGAPILAPCRIKILAIIPNWFAGQPLVYYELLQGPEAGKIQYLAEQIANIAPAGSTLQQGQPIARFAKSGTDIEFGWSTIKGVTLARATTGYTEGQITPAGRSIRAWLNSLGARAGNS